MKVILHERFTQRLREAIDAAEISQAELARRMGCSRQTLTPYLSGETCPGLDMVERIGNALELDPVMLLMAEEIRQVVT